MVNFEPTFQIIKSIIKGRKMKRNKVVIIGMYLTALLLTNGFVSASAAPIDNSGLKINATDPINNVITIAPPVDGRGLQFKVNENDFPSITLDKYNQIYLTGEVSVNGTMKLNGNDVTPANSNVMAGLFLVLFFYVVILTLYFFKRINLLKVEIGNITNGGA